MSVGGSTALRPAAVAGTFYPADPAQLRDTVRTMVRDAMTLGHRGSPLPPKAVIVPHAGYVYSGPIAASIYARLTPARNRIKRIVLMGPAHRVAVRGLAVPSHGASATPFGAVPIDRAAVERILQLPQVKEFDATHESEHCLEVQLPFLQQLFTDFKIVPIIVGDAEPAEVAAVLRALWGGPETLIVISSDLSHYHDYETAHALDQATATAITELRLDGISDEGACGRMPILGMLMLARKIGMTVSAIDVRNSGDTAGPRNRVVGYGAFVFAGGDESRLADPAATAAGPDAAPGAPAAATRAGGFAAGLNDAQRASLLDVAAKAVSIGLNAGHRPKLDLRSFHDDLKRPGASFVTLTSGGRLRGCIGSLEARRPLVADVAWNAYAAAFEDPRFKPLDAAEHPGVAVGISVLSRPEPLTVADRADLLARLRPGIDGVILQDGTRRATFLPQVWEQAPDPQEFLRHLLVKAGLPGDHWSDTVRTWRYQVDSFARAA